MGGEQGPDRPGQTKSMLGLSRVQYFIFSIVFKLLIEMFDITFNLTNAFTVFTLTFCGHLTLLVH